ncbi:SH3 domain containing GRB2 like 2a, endophilin A1 isoform X1 [Dicentrarchus labrax]|uniref:SH3 domain containing GRB2 like 2a, endophilin A1 isoform X1 n=1 Tax=Dicentrarchus labrax TaxID=13489 RepID=UPI0021F59CAC|nr:SH3 domain containing GRB2 like 2a, endophilin A1 isoform X1 [Dicentrarchus labrax]
MSVAGLKKQFHKATQKVSEKVGGAEGTKLDEDFTEMEKRMDTTARAVLDIMTKTTEYLQPNPATRAKMSMMNSMSRMRGQEKGPGYTQTETILGESMQRFGRELGEESNFGLALIDAGEAMRELGEVKDALDMEVKQNFIDPLQNLHEKDLKEIQHHLKKMEGRRLDFDYKKKRQAKVTEDELKQALEKFDDSKEIAELSMFNLLESDIEQVSQLAALVHAQVEYHSRAAEILTQLSSKIDERIRDTTVKPRKEFAPKPRTSLDFSISENHNGGIHSARSPGARSPARSPGETKVNLRRDTTITISLPSLCHSWVSISLSVCLFVMRKLLRSNNTNKQQKNKCRPSTVQRMQTYTNNEKLTGGRAFALSVLFTCQSSGPSYPPVSLSVCCSFQFGVQLVFLLALFIDLFIAAPSVTIHINSSFIHLEKCY